MHRLTLKIVGLLLPSIATLVTDWNIISYHLKDS